MSTLRRAFIALICAAMSLVAQAQTHISPNDGPGLGNLSYDESELFQFVSIIPSPDGLESHGNVDMVNGYMLVLTSRDGGGQANNGGIEFWDVSDPRDPQLVHRYDDSRTHGLREVHGFGLSSSYPGDYMVAQGIVGIQFWDLTDPADIQLLSYLDLPGINQGDYTGDWWTFWQAPYVFVAGQNSGLYVVDASDPSNPVLVRRMLTNELGGYNVGIVQALGNLLFIAGSQSNGHRMTTLDISDPTDPQVLNIYNHGLGRRGYSAMLAGGRVYTSGGDGGLVQLRAYNITHDGVLSIATDIGDSAGPLPGTGNFENGGYASIQSGYVFSGFSNRMAKFQIEPTLTAVGQAASGFPGDDEDFAVAMGNIVFVGDDHGRGSTLVPHQAAPDTIGPEVEWVHPADGASGQALTSRVGVSMSEIVDLKSVHSASFFLRPVGGGPALSGKYSKQHHLVNFSPDQPLLPGTTYEVVVTGIRDHVGNSGGTFTSTFTTAGEPSTHGPGLGNLSYDESELFQFVSIIPSPDGLESHGNVDMVNGYMLVLTSRDGGGQANNGGIEFWDVSDPRDPQLVHRYDDSRTHGLREVHGFGLSSSYPGDYMVAQGIVGIQFWDLTDPADIQLLSYLDLPGINQGDYTGDWWTFWQAPYVFVAGQNSGLYVVDASDPSNPVLVRRMLTNELGGYNVGIVQALGNLLFIAGSQSNGHRMTTLDISDPTDPQVLNIYNHGLGRRGYSAMLAGGRVYTSGGDGGLVQLRAYNITHDGVLSIATDIGDSAGPLPGTGNFENGGYASIQSGYVFSGFSNRMAKFQIEPTLTAVGQAASGFPGDDEDFAVAMGNIVFVGDDHGRGSTLVPHQAAPDTIGPEVEWVHPADGASGQALTSRVGVSMSEIVDLKSVHSASFFLRPVGGGPALSGKYSKQHHLVNFSPDQPLLPGTTYEVVVTGIRDHVGNSGGTFTSTFTTAGEPDPGPGEALVENVTYADGSSGLTGQFTDGALIYVDRTFAYRTPYPAVFEGQTYILTRNDDKQGTAANTVNFSLSETATVYVLFDSARIPVLPPWLGDGSWTATSETVNTDDNFQGAPTIRTVYAKNFSAGPVSLGGNFGGSSNTSMYGVVVVPLSELVEGVTYADGSAGQTGLFTEGVPLYTDRPSGSSPQVFVATPYPAAFEGQTYVLTRNDDKQGTAPNSVNFSLSEDAIIYVLFDSNRISPLPGWLNDGSWTATGETVNTTDSGSLLRHVYAKAFSAGSVSLGGNSAPSGSSSMYTVVVVPDGGSGPGDPDTQPSCQIVGPGPVEVDAVAEFAAAASGGNLIYAWNFGDGGTSDSAEPSHVYAEPGRYTVTLNVSNSVGNANCVLNQIVHHPLTAQPAVHSATIAYSDGVAYAVNADNDTVTAIDGLTLEVLWEVPVGNHPRTLAVAPNGDLWVVNQDNATISVLDPVSGELLDTHALRRASQPYGIAFGADGKAYVTLQGTGELIRLDANGELEDALEIGHKPRGIAISGDGQRILVTQFVSTDEVGRVREVDAQTFSLVDTFELAFDPGPDTEASGRGVPNYITSLTISPDGRLALVPSKKDNIDRGLFRDGQMLNFETMVRAIVSWIDLLDNQEDLAARIDINDRSMPQALVFSPTVDMYFVSAQGSNRVEMFDTYSGSTLGGLNTGLAPQGMVLSDDASTLFVHNFMSRSVSVFDVQDVIDAVSNDAPLLAEVATVAEERLTPEVLLGKQIFYNSADLRMSRDNYISCSACHLDGDSDGQVWDFTQVGEGFRNTISLLGRAGMGHGLVHWTANFDEIQDFENDIRHFAGGSGFLTDAQFAATEDPLGTPKAGLSPELDALAAFVTSLDRIPPSPYRNPDGTLTAEGLAGRQVFTARGCGSCHAGEIFSDGQRWDVGTIQLHSGLGIGEPLEGIGFDVPTLLGVWATAPYQHDGSAATLRDVLDNPDHVGPLTEAEKDVLVAYLLQIDESEPPPDVELPPLEISGVTALSGKAYETDALRAGGRVFIDVGFKWRTIPDELAGLPFIRTARADKDAVQENFLRFTVNREVDVYVLFDVWASALPDWLQGWTPVPELTVAANNRARNVYRMTFPAGEIVLGGASAPGAVWANDGFDNYSVVIKPVE